MDWPLAAALIALLAALTALAVTFLREAMATGREHDRRDWEQRDTTDQS